MDALAVLLVLLVLEDSELRLKQRSPLHAL